MLLIYNCNQKDDFLRSVGSIRLHSKIKNKLTFLVGNMGPARWLKYGLYMASNMARLYLASRCLKHTTA